MTINKHVHSNYNMLFVLASLACGQSDTKSGSTMALQPFSLSRVAAISDTSDDDTSTSETSFPPKERIVARRRRRPIKKRIQMGDYRLSSLLPRKSLLETSIEIVCNTKEKTTSSSVVEVESNSSGEVESNNENQVSSMAPVPDQENTSNDSSQEADDEIPKLVNDDDAWKEVHSPLNLPSFLPCPATALKDVKSICLTLEER